jgi:hypothetical protein
MKNRKMFALAVIVLVLAALACGIGGGGGETEEEAAAPTSSGGESAGVATSEEEAPAAPASAEEDLDLSSLTGGLTGLQSYKSSFSLRFVGKDEQGQPVDGSLVTQEEFTQEPRAQRVVVTSSGFSEEQVMESGTFEMTTIGDTSYMVSEDGEGQRSCVAMSASEETDLEQGMFSPDAMGGVSGAKYVGEETVNGVRAKHYTWKESGLGTLGFGSAEGEIWVAVDGEYVVKYTAEATGKGVFFGAGEEEGTVTVEYNLTEANGSFQIEPPADCEGPATDIPIMADAQDKTAFGEMVSYSSASAFADIVAFYKAEMPNSGWQPSGEPMEMEGFASLEFTKEGRTAQVMISYDEEEMRTDVIITTGEE